MDTTRLPRTPPIEAINFPPAVASSVRITCFMPAVSPLALRPVPASTKAATRPKNVKRRPIPIKSSGLKNGDNVKISGINVGKILNLELDLENYNAKVIVNLNGNIKIPDDSSARITSSSLLGGNFIDIIPGSSETYMNYDDIIYDTKDSVSFTDLLGKVVFSSNKK